MPKKTLDLKINFDEHIISDQDLSNIEHVHDRSLQQRSRSIIGANLPQLTQSNLNSNAILPPLRTTNASPS